MPSCNIAALMRDGRYRALSRSTRTQAHFYTQRSTQKAFLYNVPVSYNDANASQEMMRTCYKSNMLQLAVTGLAPGGAPALRLIIALPIASLTSGSALIVFVTNHSRILLLRSLVPCSSPTNGAVSIASNLVASASMPFAFCSKRTSCCISCCESVRLLFEVRGSGGKRPPI